MWWRHLSPQVVPSVNGLAARETTVAKFYLPLKYYLRFRPLLGLCGVNHDRISMDTNMLLSARYFYDQPSLAVIRLGYFLRVN
jgi:hypothetical protein